MNLKELMQHIPPGLAKEGSQSLEAVIHHFIHGLSVQEAADVAGITRQVAGRVIYRVRDNLLADGYEQTIETRFVYTKVK